MLGISAAGALGLTATLVEAPDAVETYLRNKNREETFAQRAEERQEVWQKTQEVAQRIKAKCESHVAAGGKTDSRGAVYLDAKDQTGKVYAWLFANGASFRLEDRPNDGVINIVSIISNGIGFAVDTGISSADGTYGNLIRRVEFFNNGLVRVVDGVPVNGVITEQEVNSTPAFEYSLGVLEYAGTLLDKAS
jgi:hypothetical protein